jgi:hypothetical protein
MSAQGDAIFTKRVRSAMQDEIDKALQGLVTDTTERRAGRIQGLRDALALIDRTYRDMTGEDRSSP